MPDRLFNLLLRLDVERVRLEERHLAFALEARGFLHRLELVQELPEPGRVVQSCVGEVGIRLFAHTQDRLSAISSREGRPSRLPPLEIVLTLRNSPISLGSPMTCRLIVSASCSTFL